MITTFVKITKMKHTPTAWLDSISEEEKTRLIGYMKKQFITLMMICIPICAISVAGVLYLNNGAGTLGETEKSIYNTVLVLSGVVCIRLLIGQTVSYAKEKNAWQKKMMLREVENIKNKNVFFIDDETKYKMIDHHDLRIGDKVEVSVAEKLPIILSIKKQRTI
jgi:hypothetical protein